MPELALTDLEKSGAFVSAKMFGANAVYERTDAGALSENYQTAADALGVTTIRFGGGQSDPDPSKADSQGNSWKGGTDWINIVEMVDGKLHSELMTFLDHAQQDGSYKVLLVIPTKLMDISHYWDFASEITEFVHRVASQYGDLIDGFQIGNEYWEIGETAYGEKASIAAEAILAGLDAAGIAEADQPQILVQMATPGNSGSEFPATPGVQDFTARLVAANQQIIDQLSDTARAAIDGVTEHYYYNKSDYTFGARDNEVNFINRDYAVWEDAFDKDLQFHITEWNIRTTTTSQQGMVAGSTLIKQFENMIEMGVDAAHIWALDYHSRTALTLDTDQGAMLDEQGRLINSVQGAVFDLMSDSLIGKELVQATFAQSNPAVEVTAYASASETVFYISSRSLERMDLSLDLSKVIAAHTAITAVKIALDPTSANGLQWENGEDADSVLIEGTPYFYNEHDVNVTLTDFSFSATDDIHFDLKPFEIVELTIETPVVKPQSQSFMASDGDDLIAFDQNWGHVDGGNGFDRLQIETLHEAGCIMKQDDGSLHFNGPEGGDTITLANIERVDFEDGTLAYDSEGLAGQAYRLYQASFDRVPDVEGLGFWIKTLDSGVVNLLETAGYFITSQEFGTAYGENAGLSDTRFLDLLYANVLDRSPDQAGYDFWSAQQDNGVSRAQMLVCFSESQELKTTLSPIIDDGIWYV
ncbi:MAG: hypothetical protein ACJAVM_000574 [Sulfitobacter sp.]|jgi:hypothetical protein